MDDIYESKDKQIVPFLLIQPSIKFLGTRIVGVIVYFKFSPLYKCQKLINEFTSRKAPLVQAKDLLDSVEAFRDRIFEMKDKKNIYAKISIMLHKTYLETSRTASSAELHSFLQKYKIYS